MGEKSCETVMVQSIAAHSGLGELSFAITHALSIALLFAQGAKKPLRSSLLPSAPPWLEKRESITKKPRPIGPGSFFHQEEVLEVFVVLVFQELLACTW